MIDVGVVGFALAAGLVAALNPCGFALLPGYLALVVAGDSGGPRSRVRSVGRALGATAVMACGFVVVFGGFALVLAPLAVSVQHYLPAVTVVIGAALAVLGGMMLAGRPPALLVPKLRGGAPTARLASMFGYGVAYAVASLSCTIGPFLSVTGTTFRSGSILDGIAAYLAYAAGMALLVGVLATAVALAADRVTTWLRRVQHRVSALGGLVLLLTGGYVAYYGVYELRLNAGATDPSDPVIEAAARVQETLASWMSSIGALPTKLGLAALIGAAVTLGRLTGMWRRRRHVSFTPLASQDCQRADNHGD